MFNCKPTLIPLRNLHQISMTLDAITKYVNICKYINLANTQDIHSYSVSQKNRIDPTNKRLINREDNSDTVNDIDYYFLHNVDVYRSFICICQSFDLSNQKHVFQQGSEKELKKNNYRETIKGFWKIMRYPSRTDIMINVNALNPKDIVKPKVHAQLSSFWLLIWLPGKQ